ncbi:helix-turn-helix domain-containing protein [Marinomonas shanghaiensis]|uniref:helix-turn-helix domain-containing protein n=1 Tax=Marinomonas shanghaiensis TaxID=2202418 RepID=UPI0038CC0337
MKNSTKICIFSSDPKIYTLYLRISRLNGVRRSLVQAKNGQAVSDIAAQWGFWHLSQFAKDYKQLFGETPSKTLTGLSG